ncbi:hypothetical protein K501DRAFT_288545 [Backusella circina FSU 941]|nr:hypothetical protein K501DRAFT_288545 [Backusella circina FSU 941]
MSIPVLLLLFSILQYCHNRLPYKRPSTEPLQSLIYYFWPHILTFLYNIDRQCHPQTIFSEQKRIIDPQLLLMFLHPNKQTT